MACPACVRDVSGVSAPLCGSVSGVVQCVPLFWPMCPLVCTGCVPMCPGRVPNVYRTFDRCPSSRQQRFSGLLWDHVTETSQSCSGSKGCSCRHGKEQKEGVDGATGQAQTPRDNKNLKTKNIRSSPKPCKILDVTITSMDLIKTLY